MRRPATLFLTLTLLIAACGDDDAGTTTTTTAATTTAGTTAATTTIAGDTTTAAPGTTTTPATTTTTTPATTTTAAVYVIDTSDYFPDALPGSGEADGSGCVTDSVVLGDGIWFGFAQAVAGGAITFDLACFFTGAAAVAAATADGAEAFDFYIRNENPLTRSVPLAAGAEVYGVSNGSGGIEMVPVVGWPPTPGSFVPCPGEFCAVWLYVNGGAATGIVEQYLP